MAYVFLLFPLYTLYIYIFEIIITFTIIQIYVIYYNTILEEISNSLENIVAYLITFN